MRDQMIQLDDRPIKSIGWTSEPDYNVIEVGIDGVTKIDCAEQFLGDYSIVWFQVWHGKKIKERWNVRNVDGINY